MLTNGIWARRFMMAVAAIGALTLMGAAETGVARGIDPTAKVGMVSVTKAERDRIFNAIKDLKIPGVDGFAVGLDPQANKIGVTIFAPKGLPGDVVSEKLIFGDNVSVAVRQGQELRRTAALGAGEILRSPSENCTLGFAVALKDGRSGHLTAGHCFDVMKPAGKYSAKTFTRGGGIEGYNVRGHMYGFGPSDWGIVSVVGDPLTNVSEPFIADPAGLVAVKGIVAPEVGMRVCKVGATTGLNCGTIRELDTMLFYEAQRDFMGRIIQPATRVETFMTDLCTEGGDSGAPIYTKPIYIGRGQPRTTMAVGITQGSLLATVQGESVCLGKAGMPNVNYAVPLSATPARSTDFSSGDAVILKVAP